MRKRLSPSFVELTQDALLKAFWYKPSCRLFLQQHRISDRAFNGTPTKANVISPCGFGLTW